MITDIQEDRLLLISDLHLGSPYCRARSRTVALLRFALENRYTLCLNGDLFDIVQSPMMKLANDAPDVLRWLLKLQDAGLKTYYVVGNHDMVFEYFLEDWQVFLLSPFLNLRSGDKRIRIEHGHLYDPAYARNPAFYQWLTGIAGLALKAVPGLHHVFLNLMNRRFAGKQGADGLWPNESHHFLGPAREIGARGFDAVIFGHTHRAGIIDLGNGCTYYNPGGWVGEPYTLVIDRGELTLARWPR